LPDGSITRCFQKTSTHEFAVQQGERFWTKALIGKNRTYPELTPSEADELRKDLAEIDARLDGRV